MRCLTTQALQSITNGLDNGLRALQCAMRPFFQLAEVFQEVWQVVEQTSTFTPIQRESDQQVCHRKSITYQVVFFGHNLIQYLGSMCKGRTILFK